MCILTSQLCPVIIFAIFRILKKRKIHCKEKVLLTEFKNASRFLPMPWGYKDP